MSTKPLLTVVTLWRGEWTPTHEVVMEWLAAEVFPSGTRFVWAAAEGSETEGKLCGWGETFSRMADDRAVELIAVPPKVVSEPLEKHTWVAGLYNHVLAGIESGLALLVEDDVVAPAGAAGRMLEAWATLPPETLALMAAYRSRPKPGHICAWDEAGQYFPWSATACQSPLAALWVGGGFTLYRTAAVQACLPLHVECPAPHRINGWDRVLSRRLLEKGGKLFVLPNLQAEHRCPEVMAHCSQEARVLGSV